MQCEGGSVGGTGHGVSKKKAHPLRGPAMMRTRGGAGGPEGTPVRKASVSLKRAMTGTSWTPRSSQ